MTRNGVDGPENGTHPEIGASPRTVCSTGRWVAPIACAVVLALGASSRGLHAQSLSDALSRMHSSVDTVRMSGFYGLFQIANARFPASTRLRPGAEHLAKYARENSQVAPAMIELLQRENVAVSRGASRELGEAYRVDYYGDLIGCVAALRDPRAVPALVAAIETGDMATRGLAALGEAAAPAVLRAARSTSHNTRMSAVATLAEMIADSSSARLSTGSRSAIRTTLLSAVKDNNPSIRMTGLDGLVYFRDSEVRSAVEDVAAHDPHMVRRNGHAVYPIRELATVTLRKQDALKERQPLR